MSIINSISNFFSSKKQPELKIYKNKIDSRITRLEISNAKEFYDQFISIKKEIDKQNKEQLFKELVEPNQIEFIDAVSLIFNTLVETNQMEPREYYYKQVRDLFFTVVKQGEYPLLRMLNSHPDLKNEKSKLTNAFILYFETQMRLGNKQY